MNKLIKALGLFCMVAALIIFLLKDVNSDIIPLSLLLFGIILFSFSYLVRRDVN